MPENYFESFYQDRKDQIEAEFASGFDAGVIVWGLIGRITAHKPGYNRTWTSEQLDKLFQLIYPREEEKKDNQKTGENAIRQGI